MCHQSVGLLQGAIERAGIATISVTVRPEITVNMNVSRAAYVRFPTGNPIGQPDMPNQQRTILRGLLAAVEMIETPGTVLEMPHRWRRMPDVDAAREAAGRPTPTGGEDGDLYATARERVEAIEREYGDLMAELDRYRQWLEAEVEQEGGKLESDRTKLQALRPQLTYVRELQEALEGPAHDGLVRVADRVIRIKHWQDGIFL